MPELASFQNVSQFECVISQDGQFTEVGDYKPNHVLYLSFAARSCECHRRKIKVKPKNMRASILTSKKLARACNYPAYATDRLQDA